MTDQPDDLRHDHHGCRLCVRQRSDAADEIERLRARVVEAEEYVARYDAIMETMSIDFGDMFPDWSASDD